jgi:enterochelin esterase-like enzyme
VPAEEQAASRRHARINNLIYFRIDFSYSPDQPGTSLLIEVPKSMPPIVPVNGQKILFQRRCTVAKTPLNLLACLLLVFWLAACQVTQTPKQLPVVSKTVAPSRTATIPPPEDSPTPTASPLATQTPPAAKATTTPTGTTPACLAQGGKVEVSQLEVKDLPDPLDYRFYLPPCYAEDLDQRYPVLYLVHGQSFTDDQWDRLGVDETVDRLFADGEIAPFLIVMPRDTRWGSAEQDPFDEAILQGLIPYIDRHYRTLAERQYRAIGGLSRGAGWAANLGLKYPELFGSVGMHSLALFWSDVPYIKLWLGEIPSEEMPRFYIDAGLNDRPDILNSSRWFESLLDQRDIPHEWHLFAGYHDEAYWSTHIEQYLRWYAAEW